MSAPRKLMIGRPDKTSLPVGVGAVPLLICGPCAIEGREHTLRQAEKIQQIAVRAGFPLVFKASYDKANRTSAKSFRGLGMEEGLRILEQVRSDLNIPVVSDVHRDVDTPAVAEVVDLIQIPAFLCRQTDLLVAAAKTGKPVMVKKGQMVAPGDMGFAVQKIRDAGNEQVLLCERGSCFGHRDLVVDFRGLIIMSETGCPVIFDATHSVQQMGGEAGRSGGDRRFVPALARAALAVGVDGIFLEAHENPDCAPSDGPNMVPLDQLGRLLDELRAIAELRRPQRNG